MELDRDALATICGGSFQKDWWPDIKGALIPGGAGVLAGASCFGMVSKRFGGTFFVPPRGRASLVTHGASYMCSGAAATIAHHLLGTIKKDEK